MSESYSVQPGAQVQVELTYEKDREILAFVIVSDDQADFSAGFLGEGTPLAQAILGHTAGELLPYRAGDARSVRILEVQPGADTGPQEDVAARREEKLRQAVEQARRTDAMIFATSFSGKWGDYDPQGIEHWDQSANEDPDQSQDPAG